MFGTREPVALVTGSGAPRIGSVIARTLGARGYRLALHANRSVEPARRAAEQLTADGVPAVALTGDLSDERQARAVVDGAYAQYGRLDVLVHAAAIWYPTALEAVTADQLRQFFDANTVSTFICAQQAGLLMVGQPMGGAIVVLGDWAIARPYLNYAAYFPSKGAIPALARSLAVELAWRNPRVRVNAILPGPVMLPPEMPADERRAVVEQTLARREGSPQHVADAAVALIENDYITGVCLPVDGGRTLHST